jgi:hypothetical protein
MVKEKLDIKKTTEIEVVRVGNHEFRDFSNLVDRIFDELDEIVDSIGKDRFQSKSLTDEEKKSISDRVKAILLSIYAFKEQGPKNLTDEEKIKNKEISEKIRAFIKDALSWGFTQEDFDPRINEGEAEENPEEDEKSEEESFENWRDQFAADRNDLAGRIKYSSSLDEIKLLEEEIDDLDERLNIAIIKFIDEGAQTLKPVMESLRRSLKREKNRLIREKEIADNQRLEDEETRWELEIKPLRDVIKEINDLDEDNIYPHSDKPDAKKTSDLEILKEDLKDALQRTSSQMDTTIHKSNKLILTLIEELISSGSGEINRAQEKIDRMIEKSKEKLPKKEISELTYVEFIDEILEKGLDPVRNEYGQTLAFGRERDLVIAFNKKKDPRGEHPSGREYTHGEILENIVRKYELLLSMLDAKLYDGKGGASTDRSQLFPQLAAYGFTRKDMLIATTYHPESGALTRQILREIIEGAAIEKPKKPKKPIKPISPKKSDFIGKEEDYVVAKEQFERDIKKYEVALNRYPRDVERYPIVKKRFNEYISFRGYSKDQAEMLIDIASYNSLAGEQGRENLAEMVEVLHPNPANMGEKKKVSRAKMFSQRLFTTFDMLNIVLQEEQLTTQTRAHNNGLEMTDAISLQLPLATYEHALERYSNPKDWRAWFLIYLETIEASTESRFGADHDSQKLHEVQANLIIHQEAYFDTDSFAGKIKIPGFCKSLFPDTFDLVVLNDREAIQERLELPDGNKVDTKGAISLAKERITPFELYPTAAKGWEQLLKFTFEDIPAQITEHHIISEATPGEKYGLLGLWFAKAGMLKVFPGPANDVIAPMLTHYIFRLFQHFVGGTEARLSLLTKVVSQIKETMAKGGLSAYQVALNEVIDNIYPPDYRGLGKLPQNLMPGVNYRRPQRQKWLDVEWEEEHPGIDGENHKPPPKKVFGLNINPIYDTERELYFLRLNGGKGGKLPLPARRDGTMIQIDEGKH